MLETDHAQNATSQNQAQMLTFSIALHPLDTLCPHHRRLALLGWRGRSIRAEQQQFLA